MDPGKKPTQGPYAVDPFGPGSGFGPVLISHSFPRVRRAVCISCIKI